jgi:ligand-binding SRPBCC domain-containing protein
MSVKKLKTVQRLPVSLEQAWDFFSSPKNLNEITPEDMTFEITSEVPEKMYPGLLISYKVRPLMNIPFNWVTEITHVQDKAFFVDEQRVGPYKMWHHEHHFEEVPGGVMMTDILHYDVGMGFLGWIASKLFVDKRVREIFDYREKKLLQLFPG